MRYIFSYDSQRAETKCTLYGTEMCAYGVTRGQAKTNLHNLLQAGIKIIPKLQRGQRPELVFSMVSRSRFIRHRS